MDVYPCLTYRDVGAALNWLADAFGVKPVVPDSEVDEAIENAAVAYRDGMVLIAAERPEQLQAATPAKAGCTSPSMTSTAITGGPGRPASRC